MLARITNDKYVYVEQITAQEEDLLDQAFSVRLPHAQYLDLGDTFFDGVYHKYNKFYHRVTRPLLKELLKAARKLGIPCEVVDDRPPPKYPAPAESVVTPDLLAGVTLDEHQVEAIKTACREEVGVFACPTGGGKTESMAGIAKIFDCPTTILTEMTVVADQIKTRLELREVASEVGMFYAGRRPNGQQVIVGSIQSLIVPKAPTKTKRDAPESYARKIQAYKTRCKNARYLRSLVGECDLLLVDECDSAVSKMWRNLFMHWFKGRRRYGFTGTPEDPDKPLQNMVLKENLGSVIHRTDRRTLERIGRIVPVAYTALAFGDDAYIKDKSAYDIAVKEHMIENANFHSLVKAVADRAVASAPNHGVLILVESLPLGYRLEELIDGSCFICGDHSLKERRRAVKAFEERKQPVLIGGKIVKRGLDLKGGCETLIIATGGKLASDFNQKVGRAVRQNAQGRAQIYDFYFLCNHYLYRHARNRLKTIVAMGYPAKVVFKHGVVEARKFIKSRFRRPRPKYI